MISLLRNQFLPTLKKVYSRYSLLISLGEDVDEPIGAEPVEEAPVEEDPVEEDPVEEYPVEEEPVIQDVTGEDSFVDFDETIIDPVALEDGTIPSHSSD
jgi:hypothetical protein